MGQNYKALYRLAHLFFHYKSKKDITKSRQLLLGEYKCKDGTMVGGLFNDRKPTNFFNVSNILRNAISKMTAKNYYLTVNVKKEIYYFDIKAI